MKNLEPRRRRRDRLLLRLRRYFFPSPFLFFCKNALKFPLFSYFDRFLFTQGIFGNGRISVCVFPIFLEGVFIYKHRAERERGRMRGVYLAIGKVRHRYTFFTLFKRRMMSLLLYFCYPPVVVVGVKGAHHLTQYILCVTVTWLQWKVQSINKQPRFGPWLKCNSF